jgi:arabinogalactan oligomer/maltooligosaccharide transport system permease protein
MSADAPPVTAPPTPGFAASLWSLPARAIAVFSGTVGLALKIFFLAVVDAIAVWAAVRLATDHNWTAVALLALTTIGINAAYVSRRAIPLKFLIPGLIFLFAFQIFPVAYTVELAFTNYSTGHILSKQDAITAIEGNSLEPSDNGKSYVMAPARGANGNLVLILVDEDNGAAYVGSPKGLAPLPKGSVTKNDLGITGAKGYTLIKGADLVALDKTLTTFTVPAGGSSAIRPQGLSTAVDLRPTLRYEPKQDQWVRLKDGLVYRDNGKGAYVAGKKDELEPGWKTTVGFYNFSRMIHNPLIRKPFIRVFIWTFVFATSTVLLSFALGLFLAITLDKPGLRFRLFYRSALVLPYAIPGFLSLLVWQGLLNDDFGVVNRILHLHIPWLFDANWAKASVILVSTWLTVPYFFLVSLGALQSIPAELKEAARVDGGSAWQVFRKVTLPLLLVAVAPLMIASFALNFNNFGNIYLLTGGGPATDQGVAGATDILISYTYKLAFASGKGGDYALASAIAIVIFFVVATISAISFSRTKALEGIN